MRTIHPPGTGSMSSGRARAGEASMAARQAGGKIERNASRQPSLVSSTPRMILSRKVVMMTSGIRRWAPLLLVVLVVATGCTRSPEARKARYLERGDAYFKKEQYREAVIEYWNVLRIDQNHPRAIAQIGLAHFQLGEATQAFRFLLRAQELTPDDHRRTAKIIHDSHGASSPPLLARTYVRHLLP